MMERESQFALTRRAAQGNSTTIKQASDILNAEEALGAARAVMGDPSAAAGLFKSIMNGFSGKRNEDQFILSLEKAGDILLESGMKPEQLQGILRAGNRKAIQERLLRVLIDETPRINSSIIARSATMQQIINNDD